MKKLNLVDLAHQYCQTTLWLAMVDVASRHVEREHLRIQITQTAPGRNECRAVSALFEFEKVRNRDKCLRCLRRRQFRPIVGPVLSINSNEVRSSKM